MAVDWESVKEELDAVDDSWKQLRFDSLSHVVEVLTSQNPEEATRTLSEQRDAIEAIVDDVVRGYHKGFNKAIHNYSQILKLFSESASGLNALKQQLAECEKLLGARHKQLQQQWYRSMTLRNVISLLDQIDNVSQVPSRIEQLITERKYYAAVQLHIKSIGMLEREGIQGVGALQDVRSELSKLRETLFVKVVEDLHLHLYNKGEYSASFIQMHPSHASDDDLSSIEAALPSATSLHPVSRRTRSSKRSDAIVTNGGPDGQLLAERRRSGMSAASSVDDEALQNGDEGTKPSVKASTPPWLEDAVPNGFVEGISRSDAPRHVKYLQTMVECLSLLDKTAAGGLVISQRLRQAVHDLIAEDIKRRAALVEDVKARVEVSKVPFGYRNESLALKKESKRATKFSIVESTPSMGPNGPAQAPARALLQSVLDMLERVLENHVTVAEALEGGTDADARSTGGYTLALVFTVSQNECQQLICDILQVSPDAASKEATSKMSRISKAPKPESNGSSGNGLTFGFRFTDTPLTLTGGGDAARNTRRRGSTSPQEGYGTGSVLAERGIYLIAALYRPTLEFTDKLTSILPESRSHLAKEGLQHFIETFIKEKFVPMIAVEYRTRAADALASSTSFRPKLQTMEVSAGTPSNALLGPSIAEQLATEVVAWARAMPKYAAEFLDLVQTIAERTLERCRAVYTEAVLGTLSSSIIGRSDIEKLMTQEAAYLSIGRNDVETPADAEDMELEMEMINLLLSLRPIRSDQLIKDEQKLVLLAALSESLDALSSSFQLLGQNTSQKQQDQRRHSSALILGLQKIVGKYRDLSMECLRTLRLEMQLQAIFYLQTMSSRVYVSDRDAEEPEDFIITFTGQIARWDDEMSHFIPPSKRTYIFGGICGLSATAFVKALSDMSLVNIFGVRQICRNCIALQQALAALSSGNGDLVQQRLDRVRTYYELLAMPFEALIAFVTEHRSEFSFQEFSNLLQVVVPGRDVPSDAFQRIGKILAP